MISIELTNTEKKKQKNFDTKVQRPKDDELLEDHKAKTKDLKHPTGTPCFHFKFSFLGSEFLLIS